MEAHPKLMTGQGQRTFVDPVRRTPEFEAAVAALRVLPPDMIDRAYAEATTDSIFKAATKGLKYSKGRHHPIRLLGKRPSIWEHGPGFEDHTTFWLRDGRPARWYTQPYSVNAQGIKEMGEWIDKGVDVSIHASRSWHFPGRTLLITMEKDTTK